MNEGTAFWFGSCSGHRFQFLQRKLEQAALDHHVDLIVTEEQGGLWKREVAFSVKGEACNVQLFRSWAQSELTMADSPATSGPARAHGPQVTVAADRPPPRLMAASLFENVLLASGLYPLCAFYHDSLPVSGQRHEI